MNHLQVWVVGVCCVWLFGTAPWTQAQDSDATAGIHYRLSDPGQVSAAVYDADGQLVRELLRGEAQRAGAHTLQWDGLDRHGKPMSPGNYEWRVLRTPGFRAEYVTSLGINSGSGRWHTWVGNHGGAASVAIDDTGMYVAAASTETAPVLLKQSVDGIKRHWTRDRGDVTRGRYQGGLSLASDGAGTLYMLQQNGFLNVIDAQRGDLRARWDVLPADKMRASDGGPAHRVYTHDETVADTDMAARGETIVVSYRRRDEVWWIDAADGSVETKVKVPAPRGVAVTPAGEVLAISEGRVLAMTPEGVQRTVIRGPLPHAHRLTVDARSGHVLVAEEAPSHQVKRYTADGELLGTYGRAGGRRNGTYEPHDFLCVTDITADGRGGFLIVEERVAPRRVAHFDADGKLVNEWYGGQTYYTWGEPDPRDPSKVWFNSRRWLVLADVDYDTGAWRVLETYALDDLGDGLVSVVPGFQGRWHVRYRNGTRYLVSQRQAQVLRHRPGALTPVSIISPRKGKGGPLARALEIAGARADADAKAFRWVDANRDGQPQAEELTFTASRETPRPNWITDTFALIAGGDAYEMGEPTFGIRDLTPTWRDGVPIYPFGDELEAVSPTTHTPTASWIGGHRRGAFRGADGAYYATFLTRAELHGTSWPTKLGDIARVVKWDAEGNLRWKVGRHAIHGGLGANPGSTPPGMLHEPVAIIGEVHGNIILADRVETPAMAWTPDGLYAGSFFDHRTDDGLPDSVYSWWRDAEGNEAITTSDNASGGRAFQADDGTVLWFSQGRNNCPIYKIHGWEGWKRQSSTITLDRTPPHAEANGRGLRAAYHKDSDLTGEPDATRIDTQIWHGIPRRKEGHHGVLNGFYEGPAYDWSDAVEPLGVDTGFAVRWTGEIEAPLTETFVFSVYTRGAVRLWIDGKQRIFAWNQTRHRWETEPIALRAGERYTVQLDYHTTHKYPLCSLNWESFSIDRRRIPQRYLYPTQIDVANEPDVRPATVTINAGTFVLQSSDITRKYATGRLRNKIWGYRQRGFGRTGAYVGYQRIDFGEGVFHLHVYAGGRSNGGFDITLEFRLDSPEGPTIATLSLRGKRGGDWRDMPKRTVSVSDTVTGVHDLYVINTTEETEHSHQVRLHSFRFER